jgi:DNA-binding SARP family transcriptional activator
MDRVCRIELFGALSVRVAEETVGQFRTRKTAELLAYLAYYRRHAHPRDILVELLWPECTLDSGRHRLSVALSSLRQQFQALGMPDERPLVTDKFSVGLDSRSVVTDVGEFEEGLRAAERASSPAERSAHLAAAVERYRGGLLPGFYEDWVSTEQQRLDERYLQALLRLTSLLEAQGEFEAALQHALRAVSLDPLREEAHREVMRLYLASGRASSALRQYQELERVLRDELDTTPGPESRELLQRVRDAAAAPPTSAPVRPSAQIPPPAPLPSVPLALEPVGGAVPVGSRFYVEREADRQFEAAVERRDMIVLVKGARQVGKTSLLARGLHQARQAGHHVALTHFQMFNESHLESPDAFLRALAMSLADQLDLDELPPDTWDPRRGPNPSFRRYVRREILGALDRPLVWGLDEVDRIFDCPYSSEVFGLFRSWHDERALDSGGPWMGLSVVMCYSTEAHLFIKNANQSPFNVGTRLGLDDFTREQVADLNDRHGSPLRDSGELERFNRLLNGHPFLVRQALHTMASQSTPLPALEARACDEEWIFGPHLRRIVSLLSREVVLREEVARLLNGQPLLQPDSFFRLRSAGIVGDGQATDRRLRCLLYDQYLGQHLS